MASIRCTESLSAARSFVQIAKRRYSTNFISSATPLEFLTPRGATTIFDRQASPSCLVRGRSQFSNNTKSPRALYRNFTTSPKCLATICVQNPQKDDDGQDMTLEITAQAAKRLSQIMVKDKNPNLALRIQVESGGCHGFQYLMSLVTIPPKDSQEYSTTVSEEDSIFQYVNDETSNPTPPTEGPKIILDEPSLELLKGSKVHFTSELIGSQFQIVDNPFAESSCGCGTSFNIK